MGKLKLTGQNIGRVLSLDVSVHVYAKKLHSLQKQVNLKLKAQPKQLFGYLLLAVVLCAYSLNCEA